MKTYTVAELDALVQHCEARGWIGLAGLYRLERVRMLQRGGV